MTAPNIREHLKAKRLGQPLEQQLACSKIITRLVLSDPDFQASEHIAVYLAMGGEVHTEALINAILLEEKSCYLPVLAQDDQKHLVFMPFDANTPLVTNRFNIPEPAFDETLAIAPNDLDYVITPLVAFDAKCHRVGMGAGFYDRTFAFLNTTPRPSNPILCGLAYGFQQVKDTEPESWDVSLNKVVTEEGMIA